MKNLNSLLFSIMILVVCFLPIQSIFAVDVPLLSDNEPHIRTRTSVRIAVWASVYDNAIVLNFNYGVGIAKITVLDETGKVVYQENLDTNVTPGTFIDTEGWDGGEYTVKISYGTVKLKGVFEL